MPLRKLLRIVIAVGASGTIGCGGSSLQGGTGGRPPGDGGGIVGGGGTSATGGTSAAGGGFGLGGTGGLNGNAGRSGSGGAIAPDGGAADGAVLACPSPVAPPSPLRRLTRFEYNNTVRDLFMNTSRPADSLPADGFTNLAVESPAGLELVDGYHKLAHDFAVAATRDAAAVAAIAGCDPAAGETACEQAFIRDFVPRVFRRALAADDATEFGEVFAAGRRLGGDFASGVRAVRGGGPAIARVPLPCRAGRAGGAGAAGPRATDAPRDGVSPVLPAVGVDAGPDAAAGREPGAPAHEGRDRSPGAASARGRSRARRGPVLHLPADAPPRRGLCVQPGRQRRLHAADRRSHAGRDAALHRRGHLARSRRLPGAAHQPGLLPERPARGASTASPA